jgi:lambda family phage portal protein
MTMLDRLFDASARAAHVIAQAVRSGYNAASDSPRWSPPPQLMFAPERQAAIDAPRAAARANQRVANGPSAEAVASVWATNLIGDGPSAGSQHPNRAMRRALESAWRRFYARCDVDGFDLCGFLIRVIRSLVIAGEALVVMTTTPRGELRLRILSPEQLDRSITRELPNGGRIDYGVERDAQGEIVAYWTFRDTAQALDSLLRPSVRILADDVVHLFDAKWPGQRRGMTWLAPVMTLLHQLDRLIDALVERANTGALFGGFISDMEGHGGGFTDRQTIDPATFVLEPGVMRLLPPGTSVTFPNVPDVVGVIDLIRHVLRQIGVGVGIPYEMLAGDLSQVNYSSAKAGFSQFYRRCRAIRASLIAARLLDPLWRRVITLEILSGRLNAPDFAPAADDYFAVAWGWPEWESLNPFDETRADVLAINAGIRSRHEVIAARGRDPEDVDAEIAADRFTPRASAGGNVTAIRTVEHDDLGRVARIVERAPMTMEQ